MQSFMYTVKIPVGLHARHAGMLVKAVSQFESQVTITCGEKSVNARKILALMGMNIRQDSLIRVDVEGPDEDLAARTIKAYIWENF